MDSSEMSTSSGDPAMAASATPFTPTPTVQLRATDTCRFSVFDPGGLTILAVLAGICAQWASRVGQLPSDGVLWITSAADGMHSGMDDPHHLGRAYDLRVHNLTPEAIYALIVALLDQLEGANGDYFVI